MNTWRSRPAEKILGHPDVKISLQDVCARFISKREFFIDNLLVRIRFIVVMIMWTGLAPYEFEFPIPGSLTSTFLERNKASMSSRA